MPEPFRSEDTDLTRLIARIQQEHGGAARIVYHDTVRKGGVLGFFAQEVHRVAYLVGDESADAATETDRLTAPEPADPTAWWDEALPAVGPEQASPVVAWQSVDDLLDQADAADGPTTAATGITLDAGRLDDFAQILREAFNSTPVASVESPAANLASVTPIGGGTGRESSVFQTVEDALTDLPPSPDAPRGAGEVLALAGPLTPALTAATSLSRQLHLSAGSVRVAGLATHPVAQLLASAGSASIATPADARRLGDELRSSPTPSVVVIPTDATEDTGRDPWIDDIVRALAPTALWVLVDATTKAEDSRRMLSELPPADAVVVHAMQATLNPETVRGLGLPIALIDGRKPDSYATSTMLLSALRSVSSSRVTA